MTKTATNNLFNLDDFTKDDFNSKPKQDELFNLDDFTKDDFNNKPEQTKSNKPEQTKSPNLFDVDSFTKDDFNSKPKQDEKSEFTKGLLSGIDNTQSLLYGIASLAGDLIGSKQLQDWGLKGHIRNKKEASKYNFKTNDINDVKSLDDFSDWYSATMGELVPTVATMIAGGGVGGGVAKQLVKKQVAGLVKERIKNKTKKEISTKTAEKITQNLIKRASKKTIGKGVTAGVGSTSIGLETGEIYGDVAEKNHTGGRAITLSLAGGTIAGALDALPVIHIANKFGLGKKLRGNILERVAKASLMTGAYEGGTEGLQTIIEEATKSLITDENIPDDISGMVLNAMAKGFAGGGTFGAIGGIPKDKDTNIDKGNIEKTLKESGKLEFSNEINDYIKNNIKNIEQAEVNEVKDLFKAWLVENEDRFTDEEINEIVKYGKINFNLEEQHEKTNKERDKKIDEISKDELPLDDYDKSNLVDYLNKTIDESFGLKTDEFIDPVTALEQNIQTLKNSQFPNNDLVDLAKRTIRSAENVLDRDGVIEKRNKYKGLDPNNLDNFIKEQEKQQSNDKSVDENILVLEKQLDNLLKMPEDYQTKPEINKIIKEKQDNLNELYNKRDKEIQGKLEDDSIPDPDNLKPYLEQQERKKQQKQQELVQEIANIEDNLKDIEKMPKEWQDNNAEIIKQKKEKLNDLKQKNKPIVINFPDGNEEKKIEQSKKEQKRILENIKKLREQGATVNKKPKGKEPNIVNKEAKKETKKNTNKVTPTEKKEAVKPTEKEEVVKPAEKKEAVKPTEKKEAVKPAEKKNKLEITPYKGVNDIRQEVLSLPKKEQEKLRIENNYTANDFKQFLYPIKDGENNISVTLIDNFKKTKDKVKGKEQKSLIDKRLKIEGLPENIVEVKDKNINKLNKKTTNPLARTASWFFLSGHQKIRLVASRFSKIIADKFVIVPDDKVGKNIAGLKSYEVLSRNLVGKFTSRFHNAIQQHTNRLGNLNKPEEAIIFAILDGNKKIDEKTRLKYKKEVKETRDIFDELLTARNKYRPPEDKFEGIEYWIHHSWNRKNVRKNIDKFTEDLIKHNNWEKSGVTGKNNIQRTAENWAIGIANNLYFLENSQDGSNRHIYVGGGFGRKLGVSGGQSTPSFQKQRKIFLPPDIASKYLNTNLLDIVEEHILASSRDIAFTEFFGYKEKKLNDLVGKMIKDLQTKGHTLDYIKYAVQDVYDASDQILGTYKRITSPTASGAIQDIKNITSVMLLSLVALMQITEVGFIATQTSTKNLIKGIAKMLEAIATKVMRGVVKLALNKNLKEISSEELARISNIITTNLDRIGLNNENKRATTKVAEFSFKLYGLQFFTDVTRIMAQQSFIYQLQDWVNTLLDENLKTNSIRKKQAQRRLKSWGLLDIENLKKWKNSGFKKDLNNDYFKNIITASSQYSLNFITQPRDVTKSSYASNEYVALFSHLRVFIDTLTNTALVSMAGDIKNNVGLYKLEPLRPIISLLISGSMSLMLYNWATTGDPDTHDDDLIKFLKRVINRTGITSFTGFNLYHDNDTVVEASIKDAMPVSVSFLDKILKIIRLKDGVNKNRKIIKIIPLLKFLLTEKFKKELAEKGLTNSVKEMFYGEVEEIKKEVVKNLSEVFTSDLSKLNKRLSENVYEKDFNIAEKREKIKKYKNKRTELYQHLIDKVSGIKSSKKEKRELMSGLGLSKKNIGYIINGKIPKNTVSKSTLKAKIKKAENELSGIELKNRLKYLNKMSKLLKNKLI